MTFSAPAVHKNFWFTALAAAAVLTVGSFILHHVNPLKRDLVATAFLMDIVITIPVAYYFLLIRPLKLRKWSIFLVFSICCAIGYLILPAHQRGYIIQLRKLTILLEAGIIIYAISRIRQIRAEYRRLQNHLPDFAHNFQQSMTLALGKHPAVKFLATELTLMRFGLFFWLKPQALSPNIKSFSAHKESGYGAFFGVILAVGIIELVAFHLLINHYSHLAAVIVSGLTAYSMIFLVGDFSAMVKSPALVLENQLLLRTGIRWRALVDRDNIESVRKVKDSFTPEGDCFKGSPMKSTYNTLITFKQPVSIEQIYRKPKMVNQLLMTIDEVDKFIELMK